MDEVLHDLANDHEGDGAPLLVREAVDRRGDLLEIGADILGLHDDDARRRGGVVIDGNARGVLHDEPVGCPSRVADLAILHEGEEVPCHRAPLSTGD